ncbi:Wadjet anti-phage system protein JetD domain-containing protein [Haloplasma contractile]|uniref:Wadjet protein JetD C-terminal domain-containing protein n=1 Tax=Haloplasma contractile SSD-17B TaxID=1033810 RepID=F7PTT2_9MOLU|nr:Wadjet anti-phage system protein JetD domain-containing protein [Haloplasma contractile]ERJ12245.1 hypothetical protein HLPCO_001772 [Haloplasma contractile SSD-17B]
MKNYRTFLLNKLIDRYENSKLFRGDNQVTVHIDFKFTKRHLGDYFNETRYELKDEIGEVCKNLESEELIHILWKKFEYGNIIDKIRLNTEQVDEVYRILNRVNKKELEQNMLNVLGDYVNHGSWISEFATSLVERLREGKSIQRYFDLNDTDYAKEVLTTLEEILKPKDEVSKRMFSINLFNNSKHFEELESKLIMIMKEFGPYNEDVDILSEENILNNPGYIYLKGTGVFKCNQETINLDGLQGEIGLSTLLLKELEILELDVGRVLTIENLASFHMYNPKKELVIYLGGYHNTIRREFLKQIHLFNQVSAFDHWGDIDLGGFRILNHLRTKTGIPFNPYRMDLDTLKRYETYAMTFNTAYEKKLKELLAQEAYKKFHGVIEYMIEKGIRLEQEIVKG